MKKMLLYVLLLTFSTVAFLGCNQSKTAETDSPVLAKVGKTAITEDDYIKQISRVPEWARPQFKDKEGKKKFLEELEKKELIYQKAQKMGLNRDKEYLDSVEEFKKMTLVSLILKKEVEEKSMVDDAEVRKFYDENQDKFTIGTQVRGSHILVDTEDEAKEIFENIKKGEDFAELAKTFSKDKGSAVKGGDLGYFTRGRMVPEFEKALFSLKPGEVSAPVKTRFGYHVIKLTDIKEGEHASFEQSEDSIRKQLIMQKRKGLFESYIEKLKEKSNITEDEEALAAIVLPWEQVEKTLSENGEQEQPEAEQTN